MEMHEECSGVEESEVNRSVISMDRITRGGDVLVECCIYSHAAGHRDWIPKFGQNHEVLPFCFRPVESPLIEFSAESTSWPNHCGVEAESLI